MACDFQQKHGHVYDEPFELVAHMTIVLTLEVASVANRHVSQLDVKNDFLNGKIHEEV